MSIASVVMEAIDHMDQGNLEGALRSASIAVGATARLAHPKLKDNEAYKQFLNDNMGLIASVALPMVLRVTGQGCLALHGKYKHPRVKPTTEGHSSLADVLYHVVRCCLIHEAGLPANVEFSPGTLVSLPDKLVLPPTIVYGLIAAVVVSPANRKENIASSYHFNVFGRPIALNDLWGRKDILERRMGEPRLTK